MIYSAPKKSGKTEIAALFTLWFAIFVAPRYGEIYICANDLEQSKGRIFQAVERVISANNIYSAEITQKEIRFPNGTRIIALPCDYAGAAGANQDLTVFSELWGYTWRPFQTGGYAAIWIFSSVAFISGYRVAPKMM